jgi:hypothetical protein
MQKKAKKTKSPTKTALRKKADSVFSTFIRLRDSDKTWTVKCPLCWAKMFWKQAQNMHFIKRSCWLYRYNEDNCHAGCYRCNVVLNWNYIVYTRYMQNRYWIEAVDKMIANNKKLNKERSKEDYEKIIKEYSEKIIKYANKLTE